MTLSILKDLCVSYQTFSEAKRKQKLAIGVSHFGDKGVMHNGSGILLFPVESLPVTRLRVGLTRMVITCLGLSPPSQC